MALVDSCARADSGMPRYVDPIPELKRQLATEIVRLMQGSTYAELFFAYGIYQPRVSDLRRGKLHRFSLQHLIRLLRRMEHGVQITVVKDPIVWRPQPARCDASREESMARGETGVP